MPSKISLDELERRILAGEISETEIRRYFRSNDDESPKPFFPGIEPDPDTVDLPPAGTITTFRQSFGVGDLLIREQRRQRDSGYRQMISDGYKGPVIVCRGDSWFLHPLLWDTIDYLRGAYAIKSFDWPGDTLDDIIKDKSDWQAAIVQEHADIFMLSGGGNDVIGGGAIAQNLHRYDPAITDPANYLLPAYHNLISTCLAKIQNIVEEVLLLPPKINIICHGYDFVIPNGGKWLGKPMSSIGITDPVLQKKITDVMVQGFNDSLQKLLKPYAPRVYYLDLRNTVTAGWDDELHPTDAGFRQVASHFRWVIDKFGRHH